MPGPSLDFAHGGEMWQLCGRAPPPRTSSRPCVCCRGGHDGRDGNDESGVSCPWLGSKCISEVGVKRRGDDSKSKTLIMRLRPTGTRSLQQCHQLCHPRTNLVVPSSTACCWAVTSVQVGPLPAQDSISMGKNDRRRWPTMSEIHVCLPSSMNLNFSAVPHHLIWYRNKLQLRIRQLEVLHMVSTRVLRLNEQPSRPNTTLT